MHNHELVEYLKNCSLYYVAKGVEESLKRNSHMNRYSQNPEPVSTADARDLLFSLIHRISFTSSSSSSAVDLLEKMTSTASAVRTVINHKSSDSSRALAFKHQTTIDAILVDFINYVGTQKGVDYGLYTQNIELPTVSEHFNKLEPAQAELLALLIEECSEVIHAATKILRHGLESRNPAVPGAPTNAEALNVEVGHATTAFYLLKTIGILNEEALRVSGAEKLRSIQKWLHHVELNVGERQPHCEGCE